MRQIAIFLALTTVGWLAGQATGYNPIEATFFPTFAAFALTLGLYSSVVGIDLDSIRNRRVLAVLIITVAVPVQILATGGVMYLIYPAGISFLIAVAITQIDPLSVDTLLQDKESMSEEAKGVLRIWASFDDPVTVLFGFLILMPLVTGTTTELSGSGLLLGLVYNLVPATALWLLQHYTNLLNNRFVSIPLLIIILGFAFWTQSYLLAALLGLLLRPLPENTLTGLITIFYYVIVFVVGMGLNSYGMDLRLGFLLAIVEFFVIQPATAVIMFNGTVSDVWRISFAQQNGLTTLLMGIAFQGFGIPVLHILLPAIVFVNILNLLINRIYTYKERRGYIY